MPEPTWNMYAMVVDGKVQKLLLPTENGVMPREPKGDHWYAVQWPTNPHFTGERMIAEMIEQSWGTRKPA